MPKVLIATRNKHKVEEIKSIIAGAFEFTSLDSLPEPPVPVEDATTFAGNATKKAVTLAKWLARKEHTGVDYVLADDSGLEVDALGGAPGVHSARFAALHTGRKGNSPDSENNSRLLNLLATIPVEERTARFRCAIAWTPVPHPNLRASSPVCSVDEAEFSTSVFEGTCEGRILFVGQGQGGFGYDPLFAPEGYSQSFAELGAEIKNQLSHRARALEKLKAFLQSNSLT
jgi:XTP/dITP diphosphohydrolase